MTHTSINYAYIETTTFCNLRCVGCNRGSVINGLKKMSMIDFDILLSKIKNEPITEAKLMGMGEPYLHPIFWKICEKFRHTFPNAYTISSTNCQYKLNSNFSRSLKYLDMVYLSIDGTEAVYEKLRPRGSWAKIISFLDDLVTIEKHNCKTPVNFTVFKSNIEEIPKVMKLIDFYKLDDIRLNLAQDWDQNTNNIIGYSDEEIEYLRQFKSYFKGKSDWEFSDCFWPKNGLYITTDGNVKTCCMNTGGVNHGNIFKDELENIHNKNSFIQIKDGCSSNNPTQHCVNCSYSTIKHTLKRILA